jgi:glyoxylase-like metal-dependent hydrolase (beta-lactamase superfamily II)
MHYRIISIGALSQHPLWERQLPERSAHATTTLIESDDRLILVDPALPAEALGARLLERAGRQLTEITDVFLTNFRPAHRRALTKLDHARWWISEAERETIGVNLVGQLQKLREHEDLGEGEPGSDTLAMLERDIATLRNCKPAPDRLASQVDLFPLPGFTPGTCGLLLGFTQATVLIAGDAVPTVEHLRRGQVLTGAYDIAHARESFAEAVEIADWLIAGHDNVLPNPTKLGF